MAGRRARRARPHRARNQHFLRSREVAAELVRESGIGPVDIVLDLGAGSGRLTAELAGRADQVIAVELDPHWANYLRGRWKNVRVVNADATSVVLPRQPFHVVSNLPFGRTNAILRHLLDDPRTQLIGAHVVVEWGVAVKRALPWPSSVNSVLWGASYRFSLVRRLQAAEFDPPPSVETGVLAIERRPVPLVDEWEFQAYRGFVAAGFRRGPRAVVAARTLRRLRMTGLAARDLDAHSWAALFRAAETR